MVQGWISRQSRSTRQPTATRGHRYTWDPRPFWAPLSCLDNRYTAISLSPPPPYPPPPGNRVDSGGACSRGSGLVHVYASHRVWWQPNLCWGPRFDERRSPTATRDCMSRSFVKYKRLHTNTPASVEPQPSGGVVAPQGCSLCAYIPDTPRPSNLAAFSPGLQERTRQPRPLFIQCDPFDQACPH